MMLTFDAYRALMSASVYIFNKDIALCRDRANPDWRFELDAEDRWEDDGGRIFQDGDQE